MDIKSFKSDYLEYKSEHNRDIVLKRIFDVSLAITGLIILAPIFIIIYILVVCTSVGSGIYAQQRVGQFGVPFRIYKFRTMIDKADKTGVLITKTSDLRVTKLGKILRKTKLDEIPQLFNVLIGNMSFVGPRPEVDKYIHYYQKEYRKILLLKPGITDYASIMYRDESKILDEYDNPEEAYIYVIMKEKVQLNLKYINRFNLWIDVKIIFTTILKIFKV